MDELAGERVAVTGGAGFIGSHIAENLSTENDVIVIDDFSTGAQENVPDDAQVLEQDVGDITEGDLENVQVLFHQAANVSITQSLEKPDFDAEQNVMGTVNLLEAARKAGVDRFVFASSSSVYGTPDSLPVSESDPTGPESPYAAGKLAGEGYCRAFNELYDLETVCLRYFNVFGPRQRGDSPYAGVIAIFVDNLLDGEALEIHGDGSQTRDFIYVKDVVEANIRAATSPEASGQVYNVGTGERISIDELADSVEEVVGRSIARNHTDPRPGDVQHSLADIDAIQSDLGFVPSTTVKDGLAQTVEWYRQLK